MEIKKLGLISGGHKEIRSIRDKKEKGPIKGVAVKNMVQPEVDIKK